MGILKDAQKLGIDTSKFNVIDHSAWQTGGPKTRFDTAGLKKAMEEAKSKQDTTPQPTTASGAPISAETQTILTDVEAGKETLGQEFKEGSLGRIDAGRSADVKDIIERRRAGLEGLSAEENQALRERGKAGIQRGTQTALRQLRGRQAGAGVRGGAALSQQANILGAGQAAAANVERDLFIQNIQQKREALGSFETSVTGAEQGELGKELFNLDQAAREKQGRISAGLGIAQLGVAERTGTKAADAAAAAGGGGGGKK